ncbi:MAG: hypothetical protein ABR505_01785 [Actinomycetota bacterium]
MSALAYLLPPLSGAIAFFTGSSGDTRFHGLQSVFLGVAWPLLLYVASVASRVATSAVFVAGLSLWLVLLVATARGKKMRLPLVGPFCERVAGFTDAP